MTDRTSSPQATTNRYRIRRELASGGMATVYLADDVTLDRPVALKVLSAELATDSSFVDRFRREAQAAGRLRHHNIVAVYDWGPHDNSYYIAMEYVEGRTLDQIVAEDGPLPVGLAARIAGQIVEGLDAAHQEGLVHRDVKPSNIIVTPSGQVKIADFGIARAARADIDLTQVGMIVGTAAYLSPEQAQGASVDPRSDLYSLGIVLFEMVTARRPFGGDNPLTVATQHVSTPAPRLRSIEPSLPVGLDDLVARLLAKDPDDRYESATRLALDLRKIEAGDDRAPVAASETPAADSLRTAVMDPAGDQPAPSPSAVDDGGARTVPPTAIMPESARPDRRPPTPPTPVKRSGRVPSGGLLVAAAIVVVGLVAAIVAAATLIGTEGSDDPAETTTVPTTGQSTTTPPSTDAPPAPVLVPDLAGRTQSEAERALADVGLVPAIELVDVDDSSAVGRVIGQNPQSGGELDPGSTVEIQVGRQPTTTSTTASQTSTTATETTVPPPSETTTTAAATSSTTSG
jgi:serine/threonine-protein kinase